jgi:hypothetical protein
LLAKTPKRKPKSNGQHAPNDAIPYEEAVAEGCKINDQMKRDERHRNMRLGELAARVERKYGDRTQAKFAKEIGVASCTLSRYQKVWEQWDGTGILAPGPTFKLHPLHLPASLARRRAPSERKKPPVIPGAKFA